MNRSVRLLVFLGLSALPAHGQQCPKGNPSGPSTASEVRTLEGRLVYHNGIRQWFELKLDKPECGQVSVELVRTDGKQTTMEVLRGCRVRTRGILDDSPTGYYSLDVFQDVSQIEATGNCLPKPPFPNYSSASPDKTIREYRVEMDISDDENRTFVFHVTSGGKELTPWQAYASYFLTGGFVLYGDCGAGFVVDRVFGTPEADPSHFTGARDPSDHAMFFPEYSREKGIHPLHLGYTCVRAK
jgi:hypothetical protein